jgi:hypothetical protein
MLPYCGRSMLEGQVRDLQAQEYLYWHLTGTQVRGDREKEGEGGREREENQAGLESESQRRKERKQHAPGMAPPGVRTHKCSPIGHWCLTHSWACGQLTMCHAVAAAVAAAAAAAGR